MYGLIKLFCCCCPGSESVDDDDIIFFFLPSHICSAWVMIPSRFNSIQSMRWYTFLSKIYMLVIQKNVCIKKRDERCLANGRPLLFFMKEIIRAQLQSISFGISAHALAHHNYDDDEGGQKDQNTADRNRNHGAITHTLDYFA